ncbi:RICIN domain-containing protein [Paenibacillus yanchengensis]|uniref:RICIN domain-containing protein n=1 Tax=Paenibacillus yanchengensis TaxID=2035833 RepID=A0ABW4YMB9_9BACL
MKQLFAKKWILAIMALVLIGSTAPVSFSETTQASNPQNKALIINVNSSKRLGIGGDNKYSAGAHIIQWGDVMTNIVNDQAWYIEPIGNGYVNIRNAESGLLLDVNGASTAEGAIIIQWPDNGGLNQQWSIVPTGKDRGHSSYIINRGSGQYLNILGGSRADGAQAIQEPYIFTLDKPAERWFLPIW